MLDPAAKTGPAGGPARTAPICELELELLRGPVSGLAALAAQWAQRHGLWLSTVSKAERGERLMHGDPPAAPAKAAPPDFARFANRLASLQVDSLAAGTAYVDSNDVVGAPEPQ